MANKTVTFTFVGEDGVTRTLQQVTTSSEKAASAMEGHAHRIGGAFSKLDGLLGQFGLPFTGVLSSIGGKLDDFESKATTSFQKVAEAGKLALVGIGVGAVAVGIESVHLADQFETAHARVETAVKNTGAAFSAYSSRIETTDNRLESLGFTNTEAEASMVGLINATHDTGKALDLMSLAADIARGRHISLESATTILTKVETGHVALLGRLGIATKDATGHTIDQQTAIERLSQMYGGQASAYTDTFKGKTQVLSAQLQDIGIKIGMFLIPIIQKLIGVISDVINWFEHHRAVAEALGVVIGTVLVTAIAAYTIAMAQAAIATIAATWPVLAVIAVVAALVVGIYELWTNWNQIWGWVRDHPAYAAVIGILGTIVTGGLLPIVLGVVWLAKNWDDVWGTIKDIAETVASDISAALQPIVDTIEAIVGAARAAARAISSIPSHIPGAGIIGDALGAIGLSEGGFVPGVGNTDSVPAMLTPGEFVVSKDMQSRGQWGPGRTAPIAASAGGVGGDQTVVVKLLLDGKTIHESLLRRNRQTGSLRLT